MRKVFESKEVTDYKDKTPYEVRRNEASKVLEKNPGLIPIIFLKKKGSRGSELDKKRFLFKKDWKISELIGYIREKMDNSPSKSEKYVIFLTLRGNVSPLATCTLQNLYEDYVDEDGFLYMVYSEEDFAG